MPLRLAIVVSIVQLTLSIRILSYTRYPLVTIRIAAHNCGKPNWHSFTPSWNWEEKSWASTLYTTCALKISYWTKLLILVSLFSGEVTSLTDISCCIHILWEVCRSVFMGHPVGLLLLWPCNLCGQNITMRTPKLVRWSHWQKESSMSCADVRRWQPSVDQLPAPSSAV